MAGLKKRIGIYGPNAACILIIFFFTSQEFQEVILVELYSHMKHSRVRVMEHLARLLTVAKSPTSPALIQNSFLNLVCLLEAFLKGTSMGTSAIKNPNLPLLPNCTKNWSLGRALIPRPLPYQGNAPPG